MFDSLPVNRSIHGGILIAVPGELATDEEDNVTKSNRRGGDKSGGTGLNRGG